LSQKDGIIIKNKKAITASELRNRPTFRPVVFKGNAVLAPNINSMGEIIMHPIIKSEEMGPP